MPLISLCSARRYSYPPSPFRRAGEISRGRGDPRGWGVAYKAFFPGGLSKIGELLINKSFSVEQVFSYFSVAGIVYIDHLPTVS